MSGLVKAVCVLAVLIASSAAALCPESGLRKCRCHLAEDGEVLDCSNTKLEETPRHGSARYELLDLSGNYLTDILDYSLAAFPKVKSLNLSGNFINEMSYGAFRGMYSLESLDLSNNQICVHTRLDALFLATERLTSLSLANNKGIGQDIKLYIAELDATQSPWQDLPSLRNLNLANCSLARLPSWLFTGMPALNYLDVSDNRLRVLPLLTLATTCRLKVIAISGNPWGYHRCQNFRSTVFMRSRMITDGDISVIGSSFKCNKNVINEETDAQDDCLKKILEPPKILSLYVEPMSMWFYVYMSLYSLSLVLLPFILYGLYFLWIKLRS